MEFRLLGPVEVVDDSGARVPLGPPRQRTLLAALCLHVGEPLCVDRLVEMLWGEQRIPATAATIVHGSVAGLRKVLEPERHRRVAPRVLLLEPDGYVLRVERGSIDVVRFEELVELARGALPHDPERAEAAAHQALELWRGRPLGSMEAEFALEASTRLEELRLDAFELRAEAALALGRYDHVTDELARLAPLHPLREQLWGLWMTALHRRGRTAEALRCYEDLRKRLAEEIGADPSPPLRALRQAMVEDNGAPTGWDHSGPPTGVVSFVALDAAGAAQTGLWPVVRTAARRHRGFVAVEQASPDSAVLAFRRASDAVACAFEIQRSLRAAGSRGMANPVRVALHTGEAEWRDGTYYGVATTRCMQLRTLAHGGQVLLSGAVAALVVDALPDGASLVDLGPHRLADLVRAERVWQLVHPELGRHFPPLSGAAGHHNLPVPITSLIGRTAECDDIGALLEQHRLVTLCGPGGSGKTRLAVEVAAGMDRRLGGAIWFVELAGVPSPELVTQAVASVLGLRTDAHRPLADALCEALADEESLVVLDNCEHVVDEVASLVQRILSGGSRPRVLATSREPLGVPGEVVFTVGPLPVGGAADSWDRIAASEAVRLFAARAAAVRPRFVVDESNAQTVGDICRRLDGMPLALELAAARVATTTVHGIAERLDDRFRLLEGVTRARDRRHRSLEAAVAWSYDLLDEEERALFEQLAVFAGSFTLEAAEAVAEVGSGGVAGLLPRLVSRSLVQVDQQPDRYRLLETLREYGKARLGRSDAVHRARQRHARYYRDIAEDAAPRLRQAGSPAWYERLAADEDNIRATLEWAFGPRGDVDAGLRTACALWFFWDVRGADAESAHWTEAGLRVEGVPPAQRAVLMIAAAQLSMRKGEYAAGERTAEDAVALAPAFRTGAAEWQDFAAAAFPRVIASCARGEFERARRVIEEFLEPSLAAGDNWYATQLEYLLARVYRDADRIEAAEATAARALARAERLGEDQVLGLCSDLCAYLARRRGDHAAARSLAAAALAHYRATGYQEGEASALCEAGRLALTVRDPAAAAAFGQAFALCRRMGHRAGMASAIEGQAQVLGLVGDASGAAALWGKAFALRQHMRLLPPTFEQQNRDREIRRLAGTLGADAFERAFAGGAGLSLDDVVELSASRPLNVV